MTSQQVKSGIAHIFLVLVLVLGVSSCSSASKNWNAYRQLSPPVRRWVIGHIWIASKAQTIGRIALALADSVGGSGTIGTDGNGGALDAFRHGVWMALLVQKIPEYKALALGRAYEKGNYWDFRHSRDLPERDHDAASSKMDLHNNVVGCAVGLELFPCNDPSALSRAVVLRIQDGAFVVLRKDQEGHSLDTDGNIILEEQWKGKWENDRTLVPSN